jgi:hypothetical protein
MCDDRGRSPKYCNRRGTSDTNHTFPSIEQLLVIVAQTAVESRYRYSLIIPVTVVETHVGCPKWLLGQS